MTKSLFIIIAICMHLNSFGQDAPSVIRFVFTDSIENIITPEIKVKSKTINYGNLSFSESADYFLKVDSSAQSQTNPVVLRNQVYTISSLQGNHDLDNEYIITLSHNERVMKINLVTDGSSFSDTLEFRKGNFVYLPEGLFVSNMDNRSSMKFANIPLQKNRKIVELDSNQENNFCSFNCHDTELKKIDSENERILLNTIKSYPNFLYINQIPIGTIVWIDNQLYVSYFSDDLIEILKNNFY